MDLDDPYDIGFPQGEELQQLLAELEASGEVDAALDAGGPEGLARLLYLTLMVETRTSLALVQVLQSLHVGDWEARLIAASPLLSTPEKLALLRSGTYQAQRATIRAALEDAEASLLDHARLLVARILGASGPVH